MNHIHDASKCPECRMDRAKAIGGYALLIALIVGAMGVLSYYLSRGGN